MSDMKSAASLSSSLLAVKGTASPADYMPAAFGSPSPVRSPTPPTPSLSNSRWDRRMTADLEEATETEEPALPVPAPIRQASPVPMESPDRDESPDREESTLLARATGPEPLAATRRVKLSLRLDAERHLRIKLAAAHLRRSAQNILTEALDHYLDDICPSLSGGECRCLADGTEPSEPTAEPSEPTARPSEPAVKPSEPAASNRRATDRALKGKDNSTITLRFK